jgi:hypothetical protein
LQTPAENQFHYLNLYTVGLIKINGTIVSTEKVLLEQIQSFIEGSEFHEL